MIKLIKIIIFWLLATSSICCLPIGPIPKAPTDLVAQAISSSQIYIKWKDNAEYEQKFMIERKKQSEEYNLIASVGKDVIDYNDIGLDSGTLYYYRVYASNPITNSGYSNEASASTLP